MGELWCWRCGVNHYDDYFGCSEPRDRRCATGAYYLALIGAALGPVVGYAVGYDKAAEHYRMFWGLRLLGVNRHE